MTEKITLPSFPIHGGCQCGAVRYTLHAPPVVFYICHCTECQKQSSSGFGESFRVRRSDLTIEGNLAQYERASAGGGVVGDFCPECGTRLFHHRGKYAETLNIKAGTLDDTRWLKPAGHIWTKSKQPWVNIDENELAYERQPDDKDAALIARWNQMIAPVQYKQAPAEATRTAMKKTKDVAHWTAHAANWITWVRTPGHDAFWSYRDAFRAFVGPGTAHALDLGAGEGRISRLLKKLGYKVTACDPVAEFIEAAREMDSADAYAVADGADLPFADDSFDLIIAYNVLMDVEDVSAVLAECRRVLKPRGELIVSIVHPFADIGRFAGDEQNAPFVVDTPYYGRKHFAGTETRDGLSMDFFGWSQPLCDYVTALADNGFAITRLAEPVPAPDAPPHLERWHRLPLFLWLRAVKL